MSEENPVYYTSIHYKYEKGSIDYGRFAGGEVFMFVKEFDVRSALARFEEELKAVNLSAESFEFIDKYEDEPWETEQQEKHFNGLAQEAAGTGEVVCDQFYAYE